MLEKNVLTFSQHLEELNLKNTAESFKREFISKPNDAYELGKYNILKHLQKELNKCTGTNSSTDYSPTSARKKMKQENPIFTNLIQKLKEGKDMNIDNLDNLDNIIKEENEIKDNDKKEKKNDKEIKKQNEPKEQNGT